MMQGQKCFQNYYINSNLFYICNYIYIYIYIHMGIYMLILLTCIININDILINNVIECNTIQYLIFHLKYFN